MRDSERSRPVGFEFARENLQSGVKEEDSITDVENTVFNFRVVKPLSFLLVDDRIFISLIMKKQRKNALLFHYKDTSCKETTTSIVYRAMINKVSKHKVFSTIRILSVVIVQVEKRYRYGYLKEIVVRRADQKLYKFKEGDFLNIHLNDIEDMLLLIAKNKLFNIDSDVIVDFITALKMFTQGIIVKNRVQDVQLVKEPYTPNNDPSGIIYEDKSKKKRMMHLNEIHKFYNGTLMRLLADFELPCLQTYLRLTIFLNVWSLNYRGLFLHAL
uniref:Uncharacterized protein n=1 Tax=Tanacetum cinerariifolium TaxID=118510 RepID=A0A6L2LV54_TANCI|nr:hypothetical protein [Tanacetum cinerariifolium]